MPKILRKPCVFCISMQFLNASGMTYTCVDFIGMYCKKIPGYDPTKLFFLCYFFFGIKLGNFAINNFFLYVTKMQAYQQKTEKFFVIEEKKFGRIDSWV